MRIRGILHFGKNLVLAGMTQIMAMPLVCAGLIVLIMVLVVLQIADSQTVVLFRNIPGVSEDLLGWCIGASGLGTLVSALLVGKLQVKPLVKMGIGAAMMGFETILVLDRNQC